MPSKAPLGGRGLHSGPGEQSKLGGPVVRAGLLHFGFHSKTQLAVQHLRNLNSRMLQQSDAQKHDGNERAMPCQCQLPGVAQCGRPMSASPLKQRIVLIKLAADARVSIGWEVVPFSRQSSADWDTSTTNISRTVYEQSGHAESWLTRTTKANMARLPTRDNLTLARLYIYIWLPEKGPRLQSRALRLTWTRLDCYKGALLYNHATSVCHPALLGVS